MFDHLPTGKLCAQYCPLGFYVSRNYTYITSITVFLSLQVLTATLMRHAAMWFLQESPPGSTPAPSVVVTMARMLATGRETVSPPAPASKTVHLNRCDPGRNWFHRVSREPAVTTQRLLIICLPHWEHTVLQLHRGWVQLNVSALDSDIMELQKHPKTNFTNIEIHQDRSVAKDSAI